MSPRIKPFGKKVKPPFLENVFMQSKITLIKIGECLNHLSANPTKWSNTLKQFVGCCRQIA